MFSNFALGCFNRRFLWNNSISRALITLVLLMCNHKVDQLPGFNSPCHFPVSSMFVGMHVFKFANFSIQVHFYRSQSMRENLCLHQQSLKDAYATVIHFKVNLFQICLLWAAFECVSLVFILVENIFGHTIHGPLKVLKG